MLIHRNTEVLNEFNCSTYCLPESIAGKVPVQPISTQGSMFKKAKRHSLLHQQQLHAYEQTTRELAAELHSTQHSSVLLKAKVRTLEEKFGHTNTRNVHKRERRREATLAAQKKLINKVNAENRELKATQQKEQRQHERQMKLIKDRFYHHKKAMQKRTAKYKSRLQRLKAKQVRCVHVIGSPSAS